MIIQKKNHFYPNKAVKNELRTILNLKKEARKNLLDKKNINIKKETYISFCRNSPFSFNKNNNLDCFALELISLILELIKTNKYQLTPEKNLPKSFYDQCLKGVNQLKTLPKTRDKNLLLIYIKQAIHILKGSQLLRFENLKIKISSTIPSSPEKLYLEVFNSFWNKVDWSKIFPSDPQAALELKKNKSIIKDLLINLNEKVQLDSLANNFFDLTGFASKNHLFSISFLDFYLFTWLKHFGIITYHNNSENSPVYISTSERGKFILPTLK